MPSNAARNLAAISSKKRSTKFEEVSIMTSPSNRKHADTEPASDQPMAPEPAFAGRARTI
jgi:hypothetical protein